MADAKIDPDRTQFDDLTGIYTRAVTPDGRWDSVDIAVLDRDSLIDFIRSRGEVSTWGVHIVLIMLGHDREGVE